MFCLLEWKISLLLFCHGQNNLNCIIAGILVDGSSILVIIMNVIFIFAISQALARGISIECGCFSTSSDSGSTIGINTIIRDIGYLIMGLLF